MVTARNPMTYSCTPLKRGSASCLNARLLRIEPTPDSASTDRSDDSSLHYRLREFAASPAGERHTGFLRKLTSECPYLHDDARGKNPADDRDVVHPPVPANEVCRIVSATCSRPVVEDRRGPRSLDSPCRTQRRARPWLGPPHSTVTYTVAPPFPTACAPRQKGRFDTGSVWALAPRSGVPSSAGPKTRATAIRHRNYGRQD